MCGGAQGRREFLARDQKAAFGLKARRLRSDELGATLPQLGRNPEGRAPPGLPGPAACAAACSPPQMLTAAADTPEAGKK